MNDVWAAMLSYSWREHLAEARFAEWLTVAAYGIAMILALMAAARSRLARRSRERGFWLLIVASLGFLAINEVLDLQTLLTVVGKKMAISGGWYEQRRLAQFAFVTFLVIAVLLGSMMALYLTLHTHRAVRLALIGVAFIVGFVLVRAASFHHMDELLGRDLAFIDYGTAQELLGIAIIAVAAIVYRPRAAARAHPPG